VFERFTDRARKAVVLAQEEARMLEHAYIGTEHLLLGLLHEGEGVAGRALAALDVSLEQVRHDVRATVGEGPGAPASHVPFTPKAKKVMELSLREAMALGHNYIGTEHLLLGVMREGEGVGAQILQKRGLDLPRVRAQIMEVLANRPVATADEGGFERASTTYEASQGGAEAAAEDDPEARFPTCPNCSAQLADWLRTRVIDREGGEFVTIAYCGSCGNAIGTVG
jgi:ATP-dependent Clp protease ATP-binding subunit ClpC